MERVTFSYNDVVVTEGELASAWQPFLRDGWMVVSDMLMSSCVAVVPLPFATDHVYFVKHGECRFIKRFHLLKKPRSQPSFVEVCSVGSRHYFGSYEIVHGEPNAVFSVLVASPTAILYRVERQDFRQVALKDALTETLLKTEAMQLTARIDETNVKQDLRADTEWEQYKRELTVSILSKHEQEHHVASFGSRSPRADSHIRTVRRPPLPVLPTSSTISSSSSSSSSSPRNGYHRRPSILVTNPTSPQRPVRDKKWLEVLLALSVFPMCVHIWRGYAAQTDENCMEFLSPCIRICSGQRRALTRSSRAKMASASIHQTTRYALFSPIC